MLVIKRLNNFGINHPGAIASLGSFDGVHLGHQAIIRKLVQRAAKTGHDSAVITFDPHPRQVLSKEDKPFLLTSLAEKQDILESLGVGVMAVIKFSDQVAAMPPEEFIRSILVNKLRVSEVICGHDCGFGAGRKGGIETLKLMGKETGIKVSVLASREKAGQKISSSLIRDLISGGKTEAAARMLGRPYSVKGVVVRGLGLGRKLGFPTANIEPNDRLKLLPREGVYAAEVKVGLKNHRGMLYIGSRPTIPGAGRTIEFNAFGGEYDLLGKGIEIFIWRYIRPSMKFKGQQELSGAIKADHKAIEKYFRGNKWLS